MDDQTYWYGLTAAIIPTAAATCHHRENPRAARARSPYATDDSSLIDRRLWRGRNKRPDSAATASVSAPRAPDR